MRRVSARHVSAAFGLAASILVTVIVVDAQTGASGWNLPAGAADEKSPLTSSPAVLAAGQKVFASKCQRCHGAEGRGDGPDASRAHRDRMNLTNPAHAAANPDGVVFHKIRTGRSSPRMPAFGEELSPEQTWAVVAYVQTLRGKS